MANKRDYYEVLGITKEAADADIKKSYRTLAKKYHPDVSKEPDADSKFQELGEAYEVLQDPEKRTAYDKFGSNLLEHAVDERLLGVEPVENSLFADTDIASDLIERHRINTACTEQVKGRIKDAFACRPVRHADSLTALSTNW